MDLFTLETPKKFALAPFAPRFVHLQLLSSPTKFPDPPLSTIIIEEVTMKSAQIKNVVLQTPKCTFIPNFC